MIAAVSLSLGAVTMPERALAELFFKALSALLGTEPEPIDDDAVQRLVDQARTGNRAAGQQLYRQHVDRVFRTMRAMLRSDADAEDVTQDALLTVLTSLDRYEARSGTRFSAWVMTIAMNTLRRRFRRMRPELTSTGELPDVADDAYDVELEVDAAQRRKALLQALAELTDRERMLVSLRYGAELNAEEIAAMAGIGAANVRKILERARDRLGARVRSLMETYGGL